MSRRYSVKYKIDRRVRDNIWGGPKSSFSKRKNSQLRLKFQVQHPAPIGHRMLRWTNDTSTSTARNVA
jgi:hypothetical protein